MTIDKSQFSEREKDVAILLLQGKSNKQIASELGISTRTAEFHLGHIYTKLEVTSRTEAILKLQATQLWESTGNTEYPVPVKSTVEALSESSENGLETISRRIPLKNLIVGFCGGLLVTGLIVITGLIIVLVLVRLPVKSLNIGQTHIDQSSISETNLGAYINECCKFVAQTFTAGSTGTLAGVTIDVKSIPNSTFHLHVAIRTVTTNEVPGQTILGETTLDSGNAPISQFITFPQTIHIIAGDQYAIVVNYKGAPPAGKGQGQGIWLGATGDTYPGGEGYTSISDGISWVQMEGKDLHFQTYIKYDLP